jgi:hypothetical protein
MKHLSLFLALLLLLTCLAGCGKDPLPTEPAGTGGSTGVTLPSTEVSFQQADDTMFTAQDFHTELYEGRIVNVTLSGDTATADSNAVQIKGSTVKITIPEDLDYSGAFDDIFAEYTKKNELVKVKTTNMGSMFRLTYNVTLRDASKEKEMIDRIRERNGNLEIMVSKQETRVAEL